MALLRDQRSLITRRQALGTGMTPDEIEGHLAVGRWIRVHQSVYAAAASRPSAERALLAACLAGGPNRDVAASHLSAAWLLELIGNPPRIPVVTIPYSRHIRLEGVLVHRSRDFDPRRVGRVNGIPCADPFRVLTDLAGQMSHDRFTPILDRALATGRVTTEGLTAEIERRRSRGRRGPNHLLRLLEDRGMAGGPEASVLEAQALRLFRRYRIAVMGREVVVGPGGRYRIDFLIAPGLAVEVDGFAYHWSPEAKAYDDARRNQLRAEGLTILVYDWRTIRFQGPRVAMEIRSALLRLAS